MNNFGNVIRFTVMNKFRSKAFIVTSIIFVLLVSLGVNVPYLISLFQSDDAAYIGMVNDPAGIAAALDEHFARQAEPDVDIVLAEDQGSAEANEAKFLRMMEQGQAEGYLVAGEADVFGFPVMTYKSENTMDFGTQSSLQSGLQQVKTAIVVAELNLTDEQIAKLNAPVQLDKIQISVAKPSGEAGRTAAEIALASGMVYVLIILLFIAIITSGQLIATEITAEKSSRVMEILVTSVKPLTQMFGKIIGMFLIGLVQIALIAAAVAVNLGFEHNRGALQAFNIDLSGIDPMLLVYALIFYLAGYLLYATLFAAVGSIVSRTEELGQAVMPVTMLSMIGYFIAIFGMQNPNSTLVEVSSFIPFFAPFLMFLRIGTTDPALWEVWLSIGLLLAAIFAFGWLSAKIYRTGVLMYGKRPTLKELRKAMKA